MSETSPVFVVYIAVVLTLGLLDVTFTSTTTPSVPTQCSYYLNSSSGVIEWPVFPNANYDGTQCMWFIDVNSANRVKLTFEIFVMGDLESFSLYDSDPTHTPETDVPVATCNASIHNGSSFEVTTSKLWLHFMSPYSNTALQRKTDTRLRIKYRASNSIWLEPEPDSNGGIRESYFKTEGSVVFQCDFGYRIIGQNRATCISTESTGQGLRLLNKCLRTCDIPELSHSDFLITHGNYYRVNSTISYQCKPPYILQGSSIAQCGVNSTGTPNWMFNEGTQPACVPNECTKPVTLRYKSGSISSPGFNTNNLSGTKHCFWIIESPTTSPGLLSLDFLKLDIPRGNAFLEVLRMDDRTRLLVLRHDDVLSNWTTEATNVEIHYEQPSESAGVSDGFFLEYSITSIPRSKKSGTHSSSNETGTTATHVEPTLPSTESNINYGIVAAGVIVPLVIISVIIIAIYIWYRKKYPVRMILGKQFAKFTNPAYQNKPTTTFTLEREVRDKDWELPVDQLVPEATEPPPDEADIPKMRNGELSNRMIDEKQSGEKQLSERQLSSSKPSRDTIDSNEVADDNAKMELGEQIIYIEEDRKARTISGKTQTDSRVTIKGGSENRYEGVLMDNPAFTMDDEGPDSDSSASSEGVRVHMDGGIAFKTMSPMDNPVFSISDEEMDYTSNTERVVSPQTVTLNLTGNNDELDSTTSFDEHAVVLLPAVEDENNNSSYNDSNVDASTEDVNNNLTGAANVEMETQQSGVRTSTPQQTQQNGPNYETDSSKTVNYSNEELIIYKPDSSPTPTVPPTSGILDDVSTSGIRLDEAQLHQSSPVLRSGTGVRVAEERPHEQYNVGEMKHHSDRHEHVSNEQSLERGAYGGHDERTTSNHIFIDDNHSVSSEEAAHVYSDDDIDTVLYVTSIEGEKTEENASMVEHHDPKSQLDQDNGMSVGVGTQHDSSVSAPDLYSNSSLSEKYDGTYEIFTQSNDDTLDVKIIEGSPARRASDVLEATGSAQYTPEQSVESATDYQTVTSVYVSKPPEPIDSSAVQSNSTSSTNREKKLIKVSIPHFSDSDSNTSTGRRDSSSSSDSGEEADDESKTNDNTQHSHVHYIEDFGDSDDEVDC